MSYTVLARRYRSTDFGGVIGQESIAKTLTNAIASDRVAHAYLFTGTRGVGKTSTARIFAAALNAPDAIPDCPKMPGDQEYPRIDVQERMAQAIMRGDDLNVIEIDGASNRSVDEARQLIANAGLAPTGNARFKVYIIDEVHMLTREAFNALLKTMEEPPSHVKFILCTTESHKVPATIQSRCQRFDFRNISTSQIAAHLTEVLKQEKIDAEQQVVWQVARLGNGSMRDALSLLDRLIAASGAGGDGDTVKLTTDGLEQMLGLPAQDMVVSLVDALADGDVAQTLERTAALLGRGIAQDQFIEVLIEHLRQLMLIGACGVDSELIELSDEARKVAAKQSQRFDAAGLVYMIALCENLQRSGKMSATPRALLDAVMVRLALAEKMADVAALLNGAGGGVVAQSRGQAGVQVGGRSSGSGSVHIPPSKKKVSASPVAMPSQPGPAKSPMISDADPARVWAAVLESTGNKPAMAWMRHLSLVGVEKDVARVATLPGRRELTGFLTSQRRQQLADLLKPILARPVRVEIEVGGSADVSGDAGVVGNRAFPRTAGQPGGAMAASDRAKVMELPLVKQVMEIFDATLIDARPLTKALDTGEGSGDSNNGVADNDDKEAP